MNQADLNIALHRAAECGDTEAVDRLLAEGADINYLLDHGADPNTVDCEGLTPLFPACGRNGGYVAAKVLLDAGANPNHRSDDGDTPLMWASHQRDWFDPENPLIALLNRTA